MTPQDLCYSKEHTWFKMEGDEAIIGITDHAQSELGDIVFVELPGVGDTVKQGEPFGTIESVKAVSDLHAPLSGKITRINQALEDTPETVNGSPYTEGWIIAIKPANMAEKSHLLNAQAYDTYINEEQGK
ncbi:MAG: glycine cleavage system protein GcvH [Candidatus Schekmanbacteria bacterium]|nr:glycine cleavage system protein GcvH [Candidatus Schekmanbacteria bacterium]